MAELNILTKEDLNDFKKEILKEISEQIKNNLGINQKDEYIPFSKVKERFSILNVNTLKKKIKPKHFGKLRLYSVNEIIRFLENPDNQKIISASSANPQ
jgi:hypothetical protein